MSRRKLRLAKRREDDALVKKLVLAELSGGLASFVHPYELEEYLVNLDIEAVEQVLELYAEIMPEELCDAINTVKRILETKIEVQVPPEVCLKNQEGQIRVE